MQVLKTSVFKPFSGILGKDGKTKEAVKNCLKMVRVTGLEFLKLDCTAFHKVKKPHRQAIFAKSTKIRFNPIP